MSFTLDPALENDSALITEWPMCQVRLHHNSAFPWIVLIPRDTRRDLADYSADEKATLRGEVNKASQLMKQLYRPDRLDADKSRPSAAQLYFDIIVRHEDDPAWPAPVFSSGVRGNYTPVTLQVELDQLKEIFVPAFEDAA